MGQLQVKRPPRPRAQEGDGFVRERIRAEIPRRQQACLKPRVGRVGVRVETELLLSLGVALLARAMRRRPAEVPAVVFAEVPLAEIAGRIAGGAERFAHRHLGEWQTERVRRPEERKARGPLRRGGLDHELEAEARRGTAGEQRGPGGGTDRRGRVSLGETRARARETVEVRGVVPGIAAAAEIPPAEVIGEDEQHVGRHRRGRPEAGRAEYHGGDPRGHAETRAGKNAPRQAHERIRGLFRF